MTNLFYRDKELHIKEGKEYIIKTEIELKLLRRQLKAKQKELDELCEYRNGMAKAIKIWEAEMKENQLTTKEGKSFAEKEADSMFKEDIINDMDNDNYDEFTGEII